MTSLSVQLRQLVRPRLLLRAARFGMEHYHRDRDLRRVLQLPHAPAPERAVDLLLAEEQKQEEARLLGDANYAVTRHVDILIALMTGAQTVISRKDAKPGLTLVR